MLQNKTEINKEIIIYKSNTENYKQILKEQYEISIIQNISLEISLKDMSIMIKHFPQN